MSGYVLLRGFIYVALGVLTAFSGWLNDLTPEMISKLTWYEWACMGVSVASAALISLRAYIDGSAERSRQQPQELLSTNLSPNTETK